MGLYMFFSLVARTATLGNSRNLHKSKMAAIDSGWDMHSSTGKLRIMCDTSLQDNFDLGNWFLGSIWRLEVNIEVKGQVKYNFRLKK